MTLFDLSILVIIFLLTSLVGVITGSNSLIAVPAMFQLGIEPKTAVATNMFGLVFMAAGGAIPFLRQRRLDVAKTTPLIVLTTIGSALGAMIVGFITGEALKVIVTVAMFSIVLFTLLRPRQKQAEHLTLSRASRVIAYLLVFVLAIYGGLYSGGYVTVLTATLVAFLGLSYSESIAATKLVNVFSSLVATLVFMWQGLVDYRLGLLIGATMFVGAYIGAHYATKLNELWLKRIFLSAVVLLAVKMAYDLLRA
ncbi:MAG: sulfite exporter TauE/SafE family protein [Pyrinomonadaceae bacterium]